VTPSSSLPASACHKAYSSHPDDAIGVAKGEHD
jgi:hypothetical protein